MRLPPRKKKIFPPVFPTDPVGAEFCKWFWSLNKGWDFIRSDLPAPGEKAHWTTEPYPIQPDELWLRYTDPNELLGVCFKKITRYIVIDLDRWSKYHPLNDEAKYTEILAVLGSIGLNSPVVLRSSWSEGLHIYYPLPKAISSFGVASAVKWTLFDHGILLGDGQLETFPNTKSFGSDGNFVQYKCHRLPLQPGSGSFLLDAALEPYSDEVADLLDEFNTARIQQNLELLKPVMAVSWKRQALSRGFGGSGRAEKWQRHLERRVNTGWTAFSQTNGLIKDIATYGRVFVRLEGKGLIDYTVQTATSAPGYEQFCRHQHEIRQRAADWSRCVEAYYWPYGSDPSREGTYAGHFHRDYSNDCPRPENNIVGFPNNERRSAQAEERIRQAVAHLEESGNLPDTATARSLAIIATAKELTGTGISQTTLHKPKYLPLWYPDHYHPQANSCVIECHEQVPAVTERQAYPMLPDPWLAPESPEPVQKQAMPDNYTHQPYMKGLCLPCLPPASDEPRAQSEAQDSEVEINLSDSSQIQINLSKPSELQNHKQDLLSNSSQQQYNVSKPSELQNYKQDLYSGEPSFDDFCDKQPLSVEESGIPDSRHLPTAPTALTAPLPHCPGVVVPTIPTEPTLAPPVPTEPTAKEDFRRVVMLRVQAITHAQQSVKNQALTSERLIRGSERAHLEQVARMQFYWESGSPTLRAEARAWAAANPGALPSALLAEEAAAAAPTKAPSPQKPAAPTTRAPVMADPHAPTQAEPEAQAPNLTSPAAPPNAATPTPPADPPADDLSLSPTTRQSDCATQDQTNPTAPEAKFEEVIAAALNTAPATEIAEAIAPTPADPEAKAPNPEQERCTPEVNQKADLADPSANSPPDAASGAKAKAPTKANTVKPPLPWNSERIKPHFDPPEPFRFGQRVMYEGQEYRISVPGYPRSMLSGMKFSVPNDWIEPLED